MSRPNPFTTSATIRFNLASAGAVDLVVYDVNGRLVKTLLSGTATAGENTVVWDGTDNANNRVEGGIFWMQMTTHDGYQSGKKMLVLR
jgi:flagellar hook assembly protein FlgD